MTRSTTDAADETVTVQGVSLNPSEMSETETALLTIIERQQETIQAELEARQELEETVEEQANTIRKLREEDEETAEESSDDDETQASDVVEVRSDGNDAGLMDIWIADIPFGKLLQRVREEVDSLRGEVDEIEEEIEEGGLGGQNPGFDHGDGPRTALEEKSLLSDESLDDESANKVRALKVAEAINPGGPTTSGNYVRTKKTDMGYMVESGAVKKALRRMGEDPHNQTVKRVMKMMAKMGGEKVEYRKLRGKNRVYVDEDLVRHIQSYSQRCDGAQGTTPSQTVTSTA